MPRINIYLSKEDFELSKSIGNLSKFVSDSLRQNFNPRATLSLNKDFIDKLDNSPAKKINEMVKEVTKKVNKKRDEFAQVGIRTTLESNLGLEKGKATFTVKPNEKDVEKYKEKLYGFCPHGAVKGFCKKGCK